MWDYETCTLLVEPIGVNGISDPFPARPWSLEWLAEHCQSTCSGQYIWNIYM
jgi:hypothetical protein